MKSWDCFEGVFEGEKCVCKEGYKDLEFFYHKNNCSVKSSTENAIFMSLLFVSLLFGGLSLYYACIKWDRRRNIRQPSQYSSNSNTDFSRQKSSMFSAHSGKFNPLYSLNLTLIIALFFWPRLQGPLKGSESKKFCRNNLP